MREPTAGAEGAPLTSASSVPPGAVRVCPDSRGRGGERHPQSLSPVKPEAPAAGGPVGDHQRRDCISSQMPGDLILRTLLQSVQLSSGNVCFCSAK